MRAMLELQKRGAILFDYGNNVRREAENAGVTDFAYPGFVPAFIRPLFCEGQGPFRWVALSGAPEDIYATDGALIDAFRDNTHLVRWLRLAHERVHFQGLPARICWLGYGDRVKAGRIFNDLVASGRVRAGVRRGRPPAPRAGPDPGGRAPSRGWETTTRQRHGKPSDPDEPA